MSHTQVTELILLPFIGGTYTERQEIGHLQMEHVLCRLHKAMLLMLSVWDTSDLGDNGRWVVMHGSPGEKSLKRKLQSGRKEIS